VAERIAVAEKAVKQQSSYKRLRKPVRNRDGKVELNCPLRP
jgi:hypothetical protein